MSSSLYLYCVETKQTVHIAENSGSNGLRGANCPKTVAAFCIAHQGKELGSMYLDSFADFIEYDEWTPKSVQEVFAARITSNIQDFPLVNAQVITVPRMSADQMGTESQHRWEEFDDGEAWVFGAILWLWEASWKSPRLAIADGDGGGWRYIDRGVSVGECGEVFPTHCCLPVAPLLPAV